MKKVSKVSKKSNESNHSVAIGVGLTALAAAATGVYFMTGKNSKNRKKVTKWANDLKTEVVKDLEKVGKVSKTAYDKTVDTVVKNYENVKNIKQDDLMELAAELKAGWDSIKDQVSETKKAVVKKIPTAKKAIKKVAPAPKKKVTGKIAKKK